MDPFVPSVIAVREKMGSKIRDQRRSNSPVYKFVKEWGVPSRYMRNTVPRHDVLHSRSRL